MILGVLTGYVFDRLQRRKRRQLVNIFKEYNSPRLIGSDEVIFDDFVEHGEYYLRPMLMIVQSGYPIISLKDVAVKLYEKALGLGGEHYHRPWGRLLSGEAFEKLVQADIVVKSEAGFLVQLERKAIFEDFAGFIKRKGYLQGLEEEELYVEGVDDIPIA